MAEMSIFAFVQNTLERERELLNELIRHCIDNGLIRSLEEGERFLLYCRVGKDSKTLQVNPTFGIVIGSRNRPYRSPFMAGQALSDGRESPAKIKQFHNHKQEEGLGLDYAVIEDSYFPRVGRVERDSGVLWAYINKETSKISDFKMPINQWIDTTTKLDIYQLTTTGILKYN